MSSPKDDRLKSALWIAGIYITIFLIYKAFTFNSPPLSPNRDAIASHGFYVFVLPSDVAATYRWREKFYIHDWDFHCKSLDNMRLGNPLRIEYLSEENTMEFSITVNSPLDSPFSTVETTPLEVHKPWIAGNVVNNYVLEPEFKGQTRLWFYDVNDIPVGISSKLPLEATIELVQSLEYIPSWDTTITNPWDCQRFYEK